MIKKIILIFLILIKMSYSSNFNFSVAPTKIEIDLKKDTVEEIYLINNTDEELKLLAYFETPLEYENAKLEKYSEVFPKLVVIPPRGEKIVKIAYKFSKDIDLEKEYKSYIIFKELPNKINKEEKNKITIYNEIGIGIIGKNI